MRNRFEDLLWSAREWANAGKRHAHAQWSLKQNCWTWRAVTQSRYPHQCRELLTPAKDVARYFLAFFFGAGLPTRPKPLCFAKSDRFTE